MEKSKVIYGLLWKFAERVGAQLVSLIVSIVLARLIAPSEYGIIALTSVFITISNVFVETGLPLALIQKKDADDIDFSTVFYFNIIISFFMYMILFFIAPIIANFYNNPMLINVIRVLGIVVIVAGLKSVQNAYVSRNMIFKKFFICTLIGTIFSAIVGIVMAYNGYGVWALVMQQLTNTIVDTIMLWIFVKWRPRKQFSLERLKGLFSYGWKIFASSLLDTGYNNLRSLIIGKVYSSEDLAFFDKGKQFPTLVVTNINTSIDSVLLPAMSLEQENVQRVKNMARKSIKVSSFVMWPLMIGLSVCAEPLIKLILTDKWLPCVPFLRIFCLTYAFQPIHTANLNAIKALGRSDLFFKLEIIKKIIGVISILATLPFGVFAMALGYFAISPINVIINSFPNNKLLSYSFKEQCKDIFPYIFVSLIMGICIFPLKYLYLNDIIIISLQVVLGIVVYAIISYIFKIDIFLEMISVIKNKICKNKKGDIYD